MPLVRSSGGATVSSSSRNVSVGRLMPTSCVIANIDPPTVHSPSSASSSPLRIRRIVLLPTPLAPTMAACSPGATPNDTSKKSWSAPGGA